MQGKGASGRPGDCAAIFCGVLGRQLFVDLMQLSLGRAADRLSNPVCATVLFGSQSQILPRCDVSLYLPSGIGVDLPVRFPALSITWLQQLHRRI